MTELNDCMELDPEKNGEKKRYFPRQRKRADKLYFQAIIQFDLQFLAQAFGNAP